jgi:hypothetical protein
MRILKYLILLLWVTISSENGFGLPILEKLTSQEDALCAEIHAIKSDLGFEALSQLGARVYQTGNSTIMAIGLENPELGRFIKMKLMEDPNSEDSGRNVLVLLRACPRIWGERTGQFTDGSNAPRIVLGEYCIHMLKHHLPNSLLKNPKI